MPLSQVLKVLHNSHISKDEESISSVLISLAIDFCSDSALYRLYFLLIVLLFVNFYTAAPASKTALNSLLSAYGARLTILALDIS